MSRVLHSEEKLIHKAKPSRWHFWHAYGASIGLATFFPPALVILLFAEMYRNSIRYYITDQRIIREFDFFHRNVDSVRYDSITDIHIKQDLMQRMGRIGSLSVNTSSQIFRELKFIGIRNPEKVENMIQKQIHRYKLTLMNEQKNIN